MTVGFLRHSIRNLALCLVLLEGSALVVGGCAGEPDGSTPTSAQADPLQQTRWGGFAPRPVARAALPPPANGADAGSCDRVDGEGQTPAWVCA